MDKAPFWKIIANVTLSLLKNKRMLQIFEAFSFIEQ